MKQRKILWLFLLCTMLLGALTVCPAYAYLGQAAAVLSENMTLIKTGLLGEKLVFRDTDFKEALGVSDFKSITICTLPSSTEGTLYLGERRVSAGQTIKRKNVGALVFIPASAQVTSTTFTYRVDGYGGGAELNCELKFIDKINYAPTAAPDGKDNVPVWTQSGVSVFGQMNGRDPEGDACEYIIVSYPKNGTLSVLDASIGTYRYTPKSTYSGKDSFSYVVRDEYGNYSALASVSLSVDKRVSDIVYVDMKDRPEYNAALVLSAAGVVSGTMVGDDTYFHPDDTVTRAQFVAMALKTHGIRADSTLSATFFDDNDDIPASLVSYVATAQRLGIVNGSFDGTALNFRPNDEITLCEAAIIMSSLIGDGVSSEVSLITDTTVPVWARADVSIMYELGIYDESCPIESMHTPMTRAAAASALFRMSSVK